MNTLATLGRGFAMREGPFAAECAAQQGLGVCADI
jgi:hypothetical protein